MTDVRQKGEKGEYHVIASSCLGCTCFQPGTYHHRGASGAGMGTHATGQVSLCCLQNAYRGCPNEPDRGFSEELLKERKKEGWKVT